MIGYERLLSIEKNELTDKPIEINMDTRNLPDDEVIDVIVESENKSPVSKYRVYCFCGNTYIYNIYSGHTYSIKGRGLISLRISDNHVDICKDSVSIYSYKENNDLSILNKISPINVFVSSNIDRMWFL